MPESWLTALALVVLVLLAINLAVFLLACYEYAQSSRQNPWLTGTQILLPRGGPVRASALLLHGFGGTPMDFRSLAEVLADRGFRVVVPAIPGQTSTSFAYSRGSMSPAAYAAWLHRLIEEETVTGGKPPMLVGTSMGGTLSAVGAADRNVAKLVLIAPYFGLAIGGDWTARLTGLLRWILPVMPKLQKGQISDPVGYKEYRTGSYLVSLRGFMQLAELARIAKSKVPGLSLPILIFASPKDTVASFGATERLFRDCEQARIVLCDRSNHILTYDFDRERITRDIVAFLTEEQSPQGLG